MKMGGGGLFGRLGGRILLAMALAALGPLVIMAYQGYVCAREAVVTSQTAHIRSVVDSRAARLGSWLAEIESDMRFLSTIPCTDKKCSGCEGRACVKNDCGLLILLEKHSCCFESVMTYSTDWKPTVRVSSRIRDLMDPMPESFKKDLAAADGFRASATIRGAKGEAFIYYGRPLDNPEQTWASFIVARLSLAGCVTEILSDGTGLGDTGRSFLVTAAGDILLDGPDNGGGPTEGDGPAEGGSPGRADEAPAKGLPARGAAALGVDASSAGEYTDHHGVAVLGAATRLPVLGWSVVTEIDRDEAYAWLAVLRTRAWITGVLTLALVLFLSAAISGWISKPLRRLAEVSQRIAAGRPDERLEPLGGAEARDVAQAFNAMLDELAVSNDRLRRAASLAAVGELSTSIVHEMRNPLSSIKLNVEALKKKVAGDGAYTELAGIALDQTARLERMLTDLLSYGKPLALNPDAIPFASLATDVSEVARNEADGKNVTITIRDGMAGEPIHGDHEQLWRALTNLVVNAVQAAPDGGEVVIGAERRKDAVAISVSDDGPGVDEALRETVFQPFFTTRDDGIGIGLANVKKIAECHGGSVAIEGSSGAIEGRDGRGATFTLLLPAKGAAS